MKLIIISEPLFFENEAAAISELFEAGLETLHLRKPDASADEIRKLLRTIPEEFRSRIVLHEHFALAAEFGLKGIHLNRRNPLPPEGYTGQISRSCHSLAEVGLHKSSCSYVFLSPIFDSISKHGYRAAFADNELQSPLIDEKVVALGGVCKGNLAKVKSLGFGGAALLGEVWAHRHCLTNYFDELKQLI